jgi:aspartate carbamoyltransferase catalytic subunit
MGIDFLVIRHPLAGVARLASGWTNASVINAGDGCDEHPTQALIDCITLIQISNQLSDYDPDCQGSDWPYLKNLHIGIVGDIVHSRVARSNVRAFTRLGAKVTLVGPPTLLPSDASSWPVDITYDLDEVISQFDVVYALRFQKERIVQSLIPSLDEYIRYWGISSDRLDAMKPHCKIMHPGPINRGVELSSQAADCEKSVILRQVNNSVPVRMAVLAALSGVYVHDD